MAPDRNNVAWCLLHRAVPQPRYRWLHAHGSRLRARAGAAARVALADAFDELQRLSFQVICRANVLQPLDGLPGAEARPIKFAARNIGSVISTVTAVVRVAMKLPAPATPPR